MGSYCFARGNEKNVSCCEKVLAARGLRDEVDVVLGASLCTGNCADGPIVLVDGTSRSAGCSGVGRRTPR